MSNLHPILKSYIPIVHGIAETFGENCEVVLHDLQDVSNSVVAIANGQVSGRSEGSPLTDLGLRIIKDGNEGKDLLLNYDNSQKDKVIKSSSMIIRDEHGNTIGCLCINHDITHLKYIEHSLKGIIQMKSLKNNQERKHTESFPYSVSDLTSYIISEVLKDTEKPPVMMDKDEKIQVVKTLDKRGIFLIKGAVQEVAKLLHVSKYTVYNYLDEAIKN
ncbi:helix-turn-helix transcriptional regulator [Siminovitchia fortis]|uniref:helix-turn-helix transcriptional regulator n=1 Tax=Siminovitchia fortis TaxID=254758 RepID=UPI0011A28D92|nr:PAS domain-containing protein [Siminovitchia fortis]